MLISDTELAPHDFYHYVEFSPPSSCYQNIFLAQISHAFVCQTFSKPTYHPSQGSPLDKFALYFEPIFYSEHLIAVQ